MPVTDGVTELLVGIAASGRLLGLAENSRSIIVALSSDVSVQRVTNDRAIVVIPTCPSGQGAGLS